MICKFISMGNYVANFSIKIKFCFREATGKDTAKSAEKVADRVVDKASSNYFNFYKWLTYLYFAKFLRTRRKTKTSS